MLGLDFCFRTDKHLPCPFPHSVCRNCPFSMQYMERWKKIDTIAKFGHLIVVSDISFFTYI